MIGKLITKVIGTSSERKVKKLNADIEEINSIFEGLKDVPDEYFPKRTAEFKQTNDWFVNRWVW